MMSQEFTMTTFRFCSNDYGLTDGFCREAAEHNLNAAAIKANVIRMADEGVFDDFLTPSGKFGVEMAREIVSRRNAHLSRERRWLSSSEIEEQLKGIREELNRCEEFRKCFSDKIGEEQERLSNVIGQLSSNPPTSFPHAAMQQISKEVFAHGDTVQEAVLKTHFRQWSEVCRENNGKRRTYKAVRGSVEVCFRQNGLTAALERLRLIKEVFLADYDDEIADPNHRVALFFSKGRVPQKPMPNPVPKRTPFAPKRVDKGVRQLDEGVNYLSPEKPHLRLVEELEPEILSGVVFEPVGYDDGKITIGARLGDDVVRLDSSSKVPETERPTNVEVVKRTSGFTYVRFVGYADEVTEEAAVAS